MATVPALGRLLERRQTTNSTSIANADSSSSFVPPPASTSTSSAPRTSSSSSEVAIGTTTTSSTSTTNQDTTNQDTTSATRGTAQSSSSTPPDTVGNPTGTSTTSKLSGNTGFVSSKSTRTTQAGVVTSPTAVPHNTLHTTSSYIPLPSRPIPNPNHVSPSGLSPTLLGALTTTFTPPPDCASIIITAAESSSDYITQGFGTTGGTTDIYIHRQSCYPEQPDLLNQIPLYSPAICPSGWQMHAWGVSYRPGMPHLTTASCCPDGATPSESWMCILKPTGTIFSVTGGYTSKITTNSYRPISNNIGVRWESTDCLLLPSGCPAAAKSSPTQVSGGLAQSAKIGIGVGVGIGGLLLIVGLVVGLLALRKRRGRISPAYTDVSQRFSSPPPTYDVGSQDMKVNPVYELTPEHEQRLPELGGAREWEGYGSGR